MVALKKILHKITIIQWILIGFGIGLSLVSLILGVADNPPGIILLYISLTCLAGAWVWDLSASKDYWTILMISLAAFPVGVVLHNLFDGLASLAEGIPFLVGMLEFLDVFFFLVAVVAVGPAVLVSLVGGIISSWRGMDRLTLRNRSVRRFKEGSRISEKKLLKLVNLARQSASGANLQPLKYILSNIGSQNELIFPTLSWAGYLKDWDGPEVGERPAAYIILVGDEELANSFEYDAGIASQSITLGAAEMGLGACLIGSIKRDRLRTALKLPGRYQILLVIALGKPAEQVRLESMAEGGSIKYWRDEMEMHHVPKRDIRDLMLDL